jgi:hypothetical protein
MAYGAQAVVMAAPSGSVAYRLLKCSFEEKPDTAVKLVNGSLRYRVLRSPADPVRMSPARPG